MPTPTEIHKLSTLIEELTNELYEASRARGKEHREIISLAEQTLETAKQTYDALSRGAASPAPDEAITLKPATLAKFVPWIIAATSAVLEALHRLQAHGG